jgi:hypothetical protein
MFWTVRGANAIIALRCCPSQWPIRRPLGGPACRLIPLLCRPPSRLYVDQRTLCIRSTSSQMPRYRLTYLKSVNSVTAAISRHAARNHLCARSLCCPIWRKQIDIRNAAIVASTVTGASRLQSIPDPGRTNQADATNTPTHKIPVLNSRNGKFGRIKRSSRA